MTVLFADVVKSMDLAAAMDAERWQQIITSLAERSAAVARRRGGRVDFTGDGVMAIFGAPKALEDHAFRGCQAALEIQESARRLAEDVRVHDGVDLALRVGVNSGEVIAGAVGRASLGYSAIGRQVGMAQRMESVAPPGGVMLSMASARLVDGAATLGAPEWVRIKGASEPVQARRLLALPPRRVNVNCADNDFVGRKRELGLVESLLDDTVRGLGSVALMVGSPGVGKSRVAREVAASAEARGFKVTWAFGEIHRRDVSFGVMAGLLRSGLGLDTLSAESARAKVHARFPDASANDHLLLDELLGTSDPVVVMPQIEPDAKRRRLTALINSLSLARSEPSLTIIEDAQWIDDASEATLVHLLDVVPRTPSLVIITARPEYAGALKSETRARTVVLAPLDDADIERIVTGMTGSNPSITLLATKIAERAAGNPFYAEEMVRELAQRGVLRGERGAYTTSVDAADVAIPATVQATIEARIDLLSAEAKRAVTAMAVIGSRFRAQLLPGLGLDTAVDELVNAEIIERVDPESVEFVFRHPLILAVAYRSMLRSERARWHSRVAAVIESTEPSALDQNAAVIAEHLRAAGELRASYEWHMRAAAWSMNRDVRSARVSWERAAEIAEALPAEDPERLSMCIAPTTMLCATDWQDFGLLVAGARFAELSRLCRRTGDEVSLAIGRTGVAADLLYSGRVRVGARLASQQIRSLESIGDPTLMMALAPPLFLPWLEAGELDEVTRWAEVIIDLAAGDPAKGVGFGLGSPLATATAFRGLVGWVKGRSGWRHDLDVAIELARDNNPQHFALVFVWTVATAIQFGVLRADDRALHIGEEVLRTSERVADDNALMFAEYAVGIVLLNRSSADDRRRGLEIMEPSRDAWVRRGRYLVPVVECMIARERARLGDRDAAINSLRAIVEELFGAERIGYAMLASGILAEVLVDRGDEVDLVEAERTLDRLLGVPNTGDWMTARAIAAHVRALLARARADPSYPDLVEQYRSLSERFGFEGHIDSAATM